MSETIDLNDIPGDIQELLDKLIESKSEALAFRYFSDEHRNEDPAPLEVSAFVTADIPPQYLMAYETRRLYKNAAEELLDLMGIESEESVAKMMMLFAALETRTGPLWYFFPNQAGNGIRLAYEKYTFVFIVNEHSHIKYEL